MSFTSVTPEDIIRRYVQLGHPNSKGWCPVLCKVCSDHGKKGNRAAFKFDKDTMAYHCFNCGHVAVYNPEQLIHLEKEEREKTEAKILKVLTAFGIPDDEWKPLILNDLYTRNLKGNSKAGPKQINTIETEPSEIPLPEHFYPLGPDDSTDKWTIIARDYLIHDRGVNPDAYPFFLSTGEGKYNQKWLGRVIIPFYKGKKLVYYQGRSLVKKVTRKYLSPDFEKDKVIFGYDALSKNTDMPLYVMEGWFDAYSIDGVAVLGNKLTREQLTMLKRCKRPKVIIPDRFGNGAELAYQALKEGWSVSLPDTGGCKDINEAVVRFGKLYVMKTIVETTQSGFVAETAVKLYCKKKR